jgi:DNA replication protein DnaC
MGGGEAPEITMCKYARLLILDDLGANDDRTSLERILQFRINRAWPTVITTGLRADGPEGIERLFGEALSARLFECGANKGKLVEVFDV